MNEAGQCQVSFFFANMFNGGFVFVFVFFYFTRLKAMLESTSSLVY